MIIYNSDYSNWKLGEILVDMKFVTEEQIMDALHISKKTHQKIGNILVSQGIITLEQLKIVLKAQMGFDAVTEEQISAISPAVISLLPEDFIRLYQVFPISLKDGNLVLGMVNPADKVAIDNVIAYSGLNPVVHILTQYEYQGLLKKYFNKNLK